jgi:hypothetical protein
MNPLTNQEFDALVFEQIRLGKSRNMVLVEACGGSKMYRAVDRALQRLRKRGLIEYVTGNGWREKKSQ